ncbi:MAG TPA: type II CAAX endopeptidase family protein [Pyrinomonadaceae bacterium]|nr:type II CAAX endopeptidase family protein [Pyrinomonadaceae bacterium]
MITNDPSSLPHHPATEPEVLAEHHYPERAAAPIPPNPWVDVLKAFVTWVGSVVLLLVVPLILLVPYFVYLAMKGAATAESLLQNKTFILLSIVGVIPAHALTLLVAWILVTNWGRVSFWQTLGFSWPGSVTPWKGIASSFGVAALLLGLGVLVTSLLGGAKTDLDRLIESSFQARIATVFLAVLTAPLVEEVVYRGMLYPAFQRLLGMGWAIAIVSLLFAGVHVWQYRTNLGVIVVITILSITLTIIRALTNKLLPSFVIHLIFNGLQSLYLILQPFLEKPKTLDPAPALIQLWRTSRHLF